jgi:hypothetical protein
MFAVFCPYQEARVLLSLGNILDMERRDDGFAIHYRCWCGHEGVHVIATDRPAAATHAAPETTPAEAPARTPRPIGPGRPVPVPC